MKRKLITFILIIAVALSLTIFVSCDSYESDANVLIEFLDERDSVSGGYIRKNIDSFSITTLDAKMSYIRGVGMYGKLEDGTEGYLSCEEGYYYAYVKSESGYYVKSPIGEEEYRNSESSLVEMIEPVLSEIREDNIEFDKKIKGFRIKDASSTIFGKESRVIVTMKENIVVITVFFTVDGKENKYVLEINGVKIKFPDSISI